MPTIMTALDARKQKYQPPPGSESVQARYVDVREVRRDVLCLRTSHAMAKREYRAVIEIKGINYLLKKEEEQELVDIIYQRFLASLTFPIQILVRVQPLDVDAYIRRYEVPEDEILDRMVAAIPDAPRWWIKSQRAWRDLANSHVQFMEQLASGRMLLERKFYLVVAADVLDEDQQKAVKRGRFLFSRAKKQQRSLAQEFARARQQLDLRCSEVARQLMSMGLRAERLDKPELVQLEYSCLTPSRAQQYPLDEDVIGAINHPVEVDPRRGQHLLDMGKKQRPTKAELERIFTEAELDVARTAVKQQKLKKKHKSLPVVELEPAMDFTQVSDLLAPDSIILRSDLICVEGEFIRTLVIRQLPRYVAPGWLRPLSELDEPMEISFHMRPLRTSSIMSLLRRKQVEYASSAAMSEEKGRLGDPEMEVARGDVEDLIDQLASGEERMLDVSMHIMVRAGNKHDLNESCDRIMAVLHSMLLMVRSATYEQDKAFRSCLPHARTEMGRGLMLSSASAATMFPFLSNTLFADSGILEGLTPEGEPVVLDWWSSEQRNANRIVVAPSGSGKSFKTKLDMMRAFMMYGKEMLQPDQRHVGELNYQIICIDPEREYKRLCDRLGGQWVRLAPGSVHHINPFELPHANSVTNGIYDNGEAVHGDLLADHIQRMQALLDIMLADRAYDGGGTLTSQEKGLLDRALFETYRRVGIGTDIRTHVRPAPLMRDFYQTLESGACGPDPTGLLPRLRRFVHGSLSGIFDGATNVELNTPLVVFDVHDLDSELRPIAFFLISNHVWSAAFGSTIPRQLVVDELLSLYQYSEGARFLETLFQRGRKHYLGVTGITQHPALLANSTIPSNCAVQILMAQEPSSLDLVRNVFKLSENETQLLKTCGKGDALLLTSDKRVFVHFEASELEHRLATTDPRELARMQREGLAELSELERPGSARKTLDLRSRQTGPIGNGRPQDPPARRSAAEIAQSGNGGYRQSEVRPEPRSVRETIPSGNGGSSQRQEQTTRRIPQETVGMERGEYPGYQERVERRSVAETIPNGNNGQARRPEPPARENPKETVELNGNSGQMGTKAVPPSPSRSVSEPEKRSLTIQVLAGPLTPQKRGDAASSDQRSIKEP
jgi:hypothetical protein